MMVKNIRIMEKVYKYNDFLTPSKKNQNMTTKSIFSSKNIKKREYKKENLTFKRPGVYIPVKYLGSFR